MTVYADTSAFYAMFDAADANHERAARSWSELVRNRNRALTSNYVIVENCALLERRLGMSAVRRFVDDVVPALSVTWVDEPLHDSGLNATLAAGKNGPSLVDCVSFAIIRRLSVAKAFAFDKHFIDQGIPCLD